MTKYYEVYLEYENFRMVCKRVPFTKDLYQEIITGKIIYPSSEKNKNKLTYGYLQRNGMPRCYEIKNSGAMQWLSQLDIEDYIYNLQRLEDLITKRTKIEIEERLINDNIEKQAGKSIKRTLRKIKQRRI